jgi:hypothetical protein
MNKKIARKSLSFFIGAYVCIVTSQVAAQERQGEWAKPTLRERNPSLESCFGTFRRGTD